MLGRLDKAARLRVAGGFGGSLGGGCGFSKVGVNVGWDKVERVIAYQQSNQEKIKETFGDAAEHQMDKVRKAAETQKNALKAIEKDLTE